jgi:hypothetical protein
MEKLEEKLHLEESILIISMVKSLTHPSQLDVIGSLSSRGKTIAILMIEY